LATSIEAKIVNALLAEFATVTLPAGVKVAQPNVTFTPDGTNPYVRLSIAKNTPKGFISGDREPIRMGFLLAVVCWPVGQGIVKPSELAGTIRDVFKFNTKVNREGIELRVSDEPAVKSDMQAAGYVEIPVVIPWAQYP